MAEKSRLERMLYATKEWLVGDGDVSTDPRQNTSRWEKIATSRANHWMTAIRLHESSNYADAREHYVFDAVERRAAGHHAKATLSLVLAAECSTSIRQTSLSTELFRLARLSFANAEVSSDGFKDAANQIRTLLDNQDLELTRTSPQSSTRLVYVL